MVGLTVTVTDAGGQAIAGLTADDFAVYEDGVQQQVSFLGNEDVPLDVALLPDTSSRMNAVQPAVKSGARALLTKVREGDRALVVDVNSGSRSCRLGDRSVACGRVNQLSVDRRQHGFV